LPSNADNHSRYAGLAEKEFSPEPVPMRPSTLSKFNWGELWIRLFLLLLSFGLFLFREPTATNPFDFYLNNGWADLGAQYLFLGLRHLLYGPNPSQTFLVADIFTLQVIFFCVLSALMLLPRVPLALLVGGQAALVFVWWTFGDMSAHGHAIEAWTIVLSAMLIVFLNYWRGYVYDYVVLFAFAVVLGFMPLMRQNALQTIFVPFAAVIGFGIIAAAVNVCWMLRRKAPGRGTFSWLFANLALPVVVFLVSLLGAHMAEDWYLEDICGLRIQPHGS